MPGCARAALADSFARWSDAIRDGLVHMIDNGVLRPDADPRRLSESTLAALQGGLMLAQVHRNTTALETALDVMIKRIEQRATQASARTLGV